MQDPKVTCLSYASWTLWYLGYPDQAWQRSAEALTLARGLFHPFSVAFALNFAAVLNLFLQDVQAVQERNEALLMLAREQDFPFWLALGAVRHGWVLSEKGQGEEGITQMRQGITVAVTGLTRSWSLGWLAEAYGKVGQAEEGLALLAEALDHVNKSGERVYEAELYRLKGELTLAQSSVQGLASSVAHTLHPTPNTRAEAEAEACFWQAIEIARRQQAKSLELRASTSLARLWQSQGNMRMMPPEPCGLA